VIETFTQDVRYALRGMKANPAFTLVAVLSMALGIGANTAIFSLLDAVMLKYLPVQHPEELLRLNVGKSFGVSNPMWEALRDRQDIFSGVFAWSQARFNLAAGGESKFINSVQVSGDFFRTLGVGAVIGRTLTTADDRRGCGATGPAAVLSYGFWQGHYAGDPAVIGKTIQLDAHLFQIVGVTPPSFFGVDIGRFFDVAVPLCSEALIRGASSNLDDPGSKWLSVIGRPKPGVTLQQVEARLNVLGPAVFEATAEPGDTRRPKKSFMVTRAGHGIAVRLDWLSKSDFRSRYSGSLTLLMVVAGLVLLIACANIANLLLARAAARQREIAIRLAVGAGRVRLIRQLLTESVLLASAGAAIGLFFASWSGSALLRLISTQEMQASLDLAIDGRLLAFTAGVALFTGALFGIAPALQATALAPHLALKETGRGLAGRHRFPLGKALVVFQIALSFVLLFGAGLFLRTFGNLLTLDAGFNRDNVLLIRADVRNAHYPAGRRQALYDTLLERISAVPGVRSASQSGMTPVDGNFWIGPIGIPHGLKEVATCYSNSVSPRYFETMGTPLRLGRDFDQRDTATSPGVVIVNETLAREVFGKENPLGRTLVRRGAKHVLTEVIGMVKDAKYSDLRQPSPATFYVPLSQRPWGGPGGSDDTNFAVRSMGPAADMIPAVKQAIAEANRDVAIEFRVFSTQVKESLVQERLLATLSSFFGALALALAIVGLYGLMSYAVGRRRSEIGIRMALGAQRRNVLWIILRDVGMLAGIGVGLGIPAAVASARLVGTMLYGTAPGDARTIATSAVVLLASAALAGYIPARRAALVDPMVALREE